MATSLSTLLKLRSHSSYKVASKVVFQIIFIIVITILLLVLDDFFNDWKQFSHLEWMVNYEYRPDRPPLAYWTFLLTSILFLAYIWATLATIRPVRIFLWLFFVAAVLLQYGYFVALHRFMTPVDVWSAVLSPGAWSDSIGMYFNWQSWVMIAIITLAIFISRPPRNKRWLSVFIFSGLVIITLLLRNFGLYDLSMGSSVVQLVQTLGQVRVIDMKKGMREMITFKAEQAPSNNVVLIIDESVRGDHLSINGYGRQTISFLQELSDKGLISN